MFFLAPLLLASATLTSGQSCNAHKKVFRATFAELPTGQAPPDNYASVSWPNFIVQGLDSQFAIAPANGKRLVSPSGSPDIPYIDNSNYSASGQSGSVALPTFALLGFNFGCASSEDGFSNFQPTSCTITVVGNSDVLSISDQSQSFDYDPPSGGKGNGMRAVTGITIDATTVYFLVTNGDGNTVPSFDNFTIGQYICD